MKWLLLMIFIFVVAGPILSQISQEDYDQFVVTFSSFITRDQEALNKKGWVTEDLFWGEGRRACKNCWTRYRIDLKKNETYVFYTMSNGPRVRVCLAKIDTWQKSINKVCYRTSDKIKLVYKARKTEEYAYLVEPASSRTGVHRSYFTKIYK